MPSLSAYHLTWVSFTLDIGYLLTAATPDLGCAGISSRRLLYQATAALAPTTGSNMLLEISGEITPERIKGWSQSKKNTQLWM